MAHDRAVRLLAISIGVFLALSMPLSAQDVVCGTEAAVARERAQRLERAAASCRRDLAEDHAYCHVRVSWKDDRRISAGQAEVLARQLRSYARAIETFDKELEERRSAFEVHTRGTYVSTAKLKCAGAGARPAGDRVTACKMACWAQNFVPSLDCWRGGIDEMGPCLMNTAGGIRICSAGCDAP
jgi:hypothetical protein